MKEKRVFSIFNSHLDLAHQFWAKVARKEDWAIDATCGNGHDTLFLAQHFEGVIGLDIQEKAIEKTKQLLLENGVKKRFYLFCQNHKAFPTIDHPIRLIVYNLGYLPGSDKTVTTRVDSTLESLSNALKLILPGGLVSITCYPGHAEGQREEEAILENLKSLSPADWSLTHHSWKNRQKSPSLILFQKEVGFS